MKTSCKERNVKHILQAIKDYKGIKTNTALAEFLGITRSALSNWAKREYLDENLIMQKIPEVTLHFLRTGEYPMTEQHDVIGNLLKRIEILERRVERLEKAKERTESSLSFYPQGSDVAQVKKFLR